MSNQSNRSSAGPGDIRRVPGIDLDPSSALPGPFPHESKMPSLQAWGYRLALMLCCLVGSAAAAADPVDYWAPWVTSLTTTSAAVNWQGAAGATGSVEYATAAYYNAHHSFDKTAASASAGSYQHVILAGLEPNTAYIYRARPSDNPGVFGNRTFRTMPTSGQFTFIVISDTHAQEKRFKYVADAITAHETDALFILDGGDYASWDGPAYWSWYFQYGDGMFAKFPIFNTIGNHEYHDHDNPAGPPTSANQYHWTFDVPQGAPLNHSFDCAGIRFVILNSPDPNNANGDDPQTSAALVQSQVSWLRQQLDNEMLGTFTIHHHPIWDYGRATIEPNLQPWETLYQTYNITANFAGHIHNYQRYSVQGIPYFVIGNAGGVFADMKPGAPTAPGYQLGQTRELGYLKVTVDPANNRATAQEIFVASVATDDAETATVHNPPIIADTVTFPLSSKASAPVPTLSEWGLIALVLATAIAGLLGVAAGVPTRSRR
jgi:acid phosphatase type 7